MPAVSSSLVGAVKGASNISSLPVPRALMHGRRRLPLGRYLRGILRTSPGFHDERDELAQQARANLQLVCDREGTAAAVKALKLAPETGLIDRFERKAKLLAKKGSL